MSEFYKIIIADKQSYGFKTYIVPLSKIIEVFESSVKWNGDSFAFGNPFLIPCSDDDPKREFKDYKYHFVSFYPKSNDFETITVLLEINGTLPPEHKKLIEDFIK